MWGNNVELERKKNRLKFILEMGKILDKKIDVIWIDETTCNLWTNKGRIWQFKESRMHIKLPERGKSITIFGALFSDGSFKYMIGDKTKKAEVLLFL